MAYRFIPRSRLLAFSTTTSVIMGTVAFSHITGAPDDVSSNSKLTDIAPLPSDYKLVAAAVFFRHGARTPLHVVPGKHSNSVTWSPLLVSQLPHTIVPLQLVRECKYGCNDCEECSIKLNDEYLLWPHEEYVSGGVQSGALTTIGQQEMYDLGQRLTHYVDELDLNDSNMYFRSTCIARCVLSLRCLLAGMFYNRKIPNLEVKIRYIDFENLFPNSRIVPKLNSANVAYCEPLLNKFYPDVMKVRYKLLRSLDLPESTKASLLPRNRRFTPMYFFRDDLSCRAGHGFSLPEEVVQLVPDLNKFCAVELMLEMLGPQVFWEQSLPYAVGTVFDSVLNKWKGLTNKDKPLVKLQVYSNHDSFMMPLYWSLGIRDENFNWPPFGASCIMEVYSCGKDNSLWARVVCLDKAVVLSGCDNQLMPFYKLESLLKRYSVTRDEMIEKVTQLADKAMEWYGDNL